MLFSDCLNRTVCLCFICKDTISAYEIRVIVLNLKQRYTTFGTILWRFIMVFGLYRPKKYLKRMKWIISFLAGMVGSRFLH